MRAVAATIQEACSGLLIFLQKLAATEASNPNFKDKVQEAVKELGSIEWLAPPMLTPRHAVE